MTNNEQPQGSEHTAGLWFGIAAYAVWGLSPLFWNLSDGVDSFSLLLYRTVWALPLLALVITVRRSWSLVRSGYSTWRSRATTTVAAVLLAINWAVFLWAITHGHVVESSLGYFINPLVSVALGVVILGETLRPLQWTAVAIATVGVAGMAIRLGTVPWIALTLAFSFGIYGLLKKRPETPGPLISLFGEVAVLSIPAVALLAFASETDGYAFGSNPRISLFLVLSGVMTVVPLLLFGAAAKRINLSTLGLLQYLAPTLQFVVGITVFGETLNTATIVGFGFVWIALALYTYDSIRGARQQDVPAPTSL